MGEFAWNEEFGVFFRIRMSEIEEEAGNCKSDEDTNKNPS